MLKIRFKRGTAAQNDVLVLNIGALSIDEENLSVRVHDGTTPGGHSLGSLGSIDSISDRLESLGLEDVDGLVIALASRIAVTELGQVLGVTQLNPEGVIPTEQLPSYVEDIIEVADLESLPNSGEVGKLYVVRTTNELYRWSGTQETYYQISGSLETTDDLSQGQVNFYFTEPRMRSSLNVEGDLSYDPETGVLSYSRSVSSVQGREGDVTVGKDDVGLELVENYPTADEEELEVAESDEHYVTALGARTFAEAMGFSDAEGQWTFNAVTLPPTKLKGEVVLYGGAVSARIGSMALVAGKLYCRGGTAYIRSRNLRVFDSVNGTWSTESTESTNNNIGDVASEGVGYNFYRLGGATNNNPIRRSSSVRKYDTVEKEWSSMASLPRAGMHLETCSMEDRIYVIYPDGEFYYLDLLLNNWFQLNGLNNYAYSDTASYRRLQVIDGAIHFWHTDSKILYRYSAARDEWSDVAHLPQLTAIGSSPFEAFGSIYYMQDSSFRVYDYNLSESTMEVLELDRSDIGNGCGMEFEGKLMFIAGNRPVIIE